MGDTPVTQKGVASARQGVRCSADRPRRVAPGPPSHGSEGRGGAQWSERVRRRSWPGTLEPAVPPGEPGFPSAPLSVFGFVFSNYKVTTHSL